MNLADTFLHADQKVNEKFKELSEKEQNELLQWVESHRDTAISSETLARIRKEIVSDPSYKIAAEYCSHITEDVQIKPDTVESTIAEKVLWAIRLAGDHGSFQNEKSRGAIDGSTARQLFAPFMVRAVPYVWNNEIFSMVGKTPLPRHTITSHLPFDATWFTFEDGMKMMSVLDASKPFGPGNIGDQWGHNIADGVLAVQLNAKIRLVLLGSDLESKIPFWQALDIPQGAIYPDDVVLSAQLMVQAWLSCLSFINSPYIVLECRRPNRNLRRRIGFEGEVAESNIARFITLRAPLYKRDSHESHSDINWKFRWMVRGHHRAQWCPSTKDHKLMWIAPYVKGPEGMPMKTAAYKVVR